MSAYTQEQTAFFFDVMALGAWLEDQGYEPAFGEAWRPQWVAEVYAAQGKGSKVSLHIDRMAVDIVIRKDGKEVGAADYKRCGEAWKAIDPRNCWGGDFKGKTAGDFQHFSRGYGGRK